MSTPPTLDSSTWGVVQWVITTIITSILGVVGYVMTTAGKLTLHSSLLDHQKEDINNLYKDIHNLEEKISTRPSHEDIAKLIKFMQEGIEARLDAINFRLTQIDERIDTFLSRH